MTRFFLPLPSASVTDRREAVAAAIRMMVRTLVVCIAVAHVLGAPPADAQYAETARPLAALDGTSSAAAQIGRRLFVAGAFSHVSPPTGGAVVVDGASTHVPGAFPFFDGTVHEILADGYGGWVIVGAFARVNGQPLSSFARIAPDRTVDPRYRITADGAIRQVAIGHGRVYFMGDFTAINGVRRLGLAALDAATGRLSSWGSGFDPGVDAFTGQRRALHDLSISSIGVYVSGGGSGLRFPESAPAGRLWGFEAGSGARLFERTAFVTAIAATSTRVYVGGWGVQRPLWAVDPLTGTDVPWSVGLTFLPQGSQDARVTSLLVDGARLYLGGFFRTADDRFSVAAVDAATGQPSTWRAAEPPASPTEVVRLTRLGQGLVATYFSLSGRPLSAYDVTTGALLPWNPHTFGSVLTLAAVPEGAVLGGNFNGIDGVVRQGLASFDLDTGQLEPWTTTLPESVRLERLETDGTFLVGATSTAQFFKIDPISGAVLGAVDFGSNVYSVVERLVGDRIVVVAAHSQLGMIATADWSRQSMPLTLNGFQTNVVHELEVVGNTAYLAGRFAAVNGVSRPFLAAIDLGTGAVLPFNASPDAEVEAIRFANGRLWVGGRFRRIGGARRRGLAELDLVTGRALAWNPDAPGGASLDVDNEAMLFVAPSTTISGRSRGRLVAFSPSTRTWQPWRPDVGDDPLFVEEHPLSRRAAFLPDCLMLMDDTVACYPSALPSPTAQTVQHDGNLVTFSWTLPAAAPVWTGLRVDVGTREGTSDLASVELPADATSLAGPVPPGSYFARVRTIGPTTTGLPTPDVSFAVGPPDVPAPPLDATAITEGTILTFRWQPPSTGTPPGYVLEAGTGEGLSDVGSLALSGGATSFAIDAPPGRYWGRVKATNAAGSSAPSSELILDVDATGSPCYETPPLAPSSLTASVSERSVSLSWAQPDSGPVANTQRVVAGTASGLDDLGAIDVPAPATSFSTTAPPGTYYVRVIAINSCGASSSSNEVRVAVP